MKDKATELQRVKLMELLFIEAKKIIQYVNESSCRMGELINNELEACCTFLKRTNNEDIYNYEIRKNIREMIIDLSLLKSHYSNGYKLDTKSEHSIFIKNKNGEITQFELSNYQPKLEKYNQWLDDISNKTLTKHDVLTLLLYISKVIGLEKNEYKFFIEEEFKIRVSAKQPPYKTILTDNALLMPPIEFIEEGDGFFYNVFGNKHVRWNMSSIEGAIEAYKEEKEKILLNKNYIKASRLNDHILEIYTLINS